MQKPVLACLDLEGVLVPEIWINVALKTGIEELKVTTREMPDYDALMKRRLAILAQHNLTIADIQEVIAGMGPLDGAKEFLTWLRERCQVVILSDTFYQFALPLMRQLGFPTLFCNQLEINGNGNAPAGTPAWSAAAWYDARSVETTAGVLGSCSPSRAGL